MHLLLIGKVKKEIEKEIGNIKDNYWKDKAILHFRCSDVPFIKHPDYHLLPKEYYYFVADELKKSDIKEMVVFNCMSHKKHSLATEKCPYYLNTLCDWIQEKCDIKIDRQMKCISIEESYKAMISCKKLISTGGSFSFIPGILKDKDFISPALLKEKDLSKEKYEKLHEKVHWTMWQERKIISHTSVNYENLIYEDF